MDLTRRTFLGTAAGGLAASATEVYAASVAETHSTYSQ